MMQNKEANKIYKKLYSDYMETKGMDLKFNGGQAFRLSNAEYAKVKYDYIRIRGYGTQSIEFSLNKIGNVSFAIALFSGDASLLRLYGNEKIMEELTENGLGDGTNWGAKHIGPNAVNLGLEEKIILESHGDENYFKPLQKYSVYFSYIAQSEIGNRGNHEDGGIAIIVPLVEAKPEHAMLAFTLSHSLDIHLIMGKDIFTLYSKLPECVMMLDMNVKTKRLMFNHHNRKSFEIFGLPRRNLYFKSIESFFDGLPKNKRLWEVINRRESVAAEEMPISAGGKEVDCILSTEIYSVDADRSHVMSLNIVSREQATANISKQVSNSAILELGNVVGQDPVFKSTIKRACLLANSDSNIMILGESGAGKDIFAQVIHNISERKGKPFIAVNCGALPRDLIGSELFGYESGAFTGARRQGNIGKFELANGGTIFLDEIGELPLEQQATLLRVVEQKKLRRLGGSKLIDIDVKIISATNADMVAMIEQKKFRTDLYYRLSTLSMSIPPLRERGKDIILLAEHFIELISKRIGRTSILKLTPEAKKLLLQLPWYGNVRELQNLMESIVQLYSGEYLLPEFIMENLSALNKAALTKNISVPLEERSVTRENVTSRNILTKEKIEEALEACNGNRSEAARYLGVARKTLYRNMDKLGMK